MVIPTRPEYMDRRGLSYLKSNKIFVLTLGSSLPQKFLKLNHTKISAQQNSVSTKSTETPLKNRNKQQLKKFLQNSQF